jgi:hypothetical protein
VLCCPCDELITRPGSHIVRHKSIEKPLGWPSAPGGVPGNVDNIHILKRPEKKVNKMNSATASCNETDVNRLLQVHFNNFPRISFQNTKTNWIRNKGYVEHGTAR